MDANIHDPEFGPPVDESGFRFRRARVGHQAGAKNLGASVFELEPGQSQFPYHYHYASEELLVVLDGEPELRDPDGWRRLSAGEVVSFPAGEEGGHQIANRSDSTVRIMLVSEMNFPDVVVLPDSGKVSSFTGPPDAEGTFWHTSSMEDGVAYMDGESPPGDPGPR